MLPEVTRRAALDHGDHAAYITADGWDVSYRELDLLSDEAACWMRSLAIGEGSVVALCLPSTVDYIVAYLAAAKLGAITAGINPRFRSRERVMCLEVLRPDLVLASSDVIDDIPSGTTGVAVELVAVSATAEEILSGQRLIGEAPGELTADVDRPVCVCFTSGSTGAPKGAWYTNRQLRVIAELDTGGGWGGGGHRYASTEFAHVGVMTKLPWLLATGGTTHLLEKWRAEPVLELIDRYRMSSVSAIAPQVALMLRVPELDRYDFSCVQAIVSGGALATPTLVRAGRQLFGAPWSIRYSSTESGGVGLGTALDADDDEALHTVGRPRPGVEAELRDGAGHKVPDGIVGELWLRSEAVMSGYWNDPESTAATIVDGWLRTGDLALVDERGCFRLAGRTHEMYIRGGYNVYPLEVESVLAGHPAVADIAIVARPDEVMGEVGVAVVVAHDPSSPPTLEDLRSFGSAVLADYKLPEGIRIVDSLPVNATDKLDRRALEAADSGDFG